MGIIRRQSSARAGAKCQHCGWESPLISQALGLCLDCIRGDFAPVLPMIEKAHSVARRSFNLPGQPPRDEGGLKCQLCANKCRIPPNGKGYCGLRTNKGNKLEGATAEKGNVSWYYDACLGAVVGLYCVTHSPYAWVAGDQSGGEILLLADRWLKEQLEKEGIKMRRLL